MGGKGDSVLDGSEAIALLRKIDKMQHSRCYGCPACMAHKFLFGHWPSGTVFECCWPKAHLAAGASP